MARGKYNVTIARRADRMLIRHTEFLAKISLVAARRLLAGFRTSTTRIANNPFQFPYADETDAPGIPPETYRKCLFDGRYKAFFLVDGEDVYIDVIIDSRQENIDLF